MRGISGTSREVAMSKDSRRVRSCRWGGSLLVVSPALACVCQLRDCLQGDGLPFPAVVKG